MAEAILVFVLVISSMNTSKSIANQLGPYSDKASCEAVRASGPLEGYKSSCIQVSIPVQTLPIAIHAKK